MTEGTEGHVVRKTVATAPTPAQLAAVIRETAEPPTEAYRTDLARDENWSARNPGTGFVHITRELGTELHPLPKAQPWIEDKREPYRFGHALPSRWCPQVSALLKTHMRRVAQH